MLEAGYREEMDLQAGIDLALEGLEATNDDLTAEGVELATVDAEFERFEPVERDTIEAHLGGESDE